MSKFGKVNPIKICIAMRILRFLPLIFILLLANGALAQTVIFSENFEAFPLPNLTSSGIPGWSQNSRLASGGLLCDSTSCLNAGDSSVLAMTASLSTTGYGFVMLEFDHICKVEFYDGGYIEVSGNGGITWTRLTGQHYLGSGQFANSGSKFNSTSYGDWLPGNPSMPQNTWWKHEYFDISSLAANSTGVRVRFILKDENNQSIFDNHGWFLDNVKVTAALSELTPPSITLVPPIWQGFKFSLGPFPVQAVLADTSGIDTAWVVYRVNQGLWDSVPMVPDTGLVFKGIIPAVNDLDTIDYLLVAVDGSLSHNTGYHPSVGYLTLVASSGLYTPYETNFEAIDSLWTPDATSTTTAWQYGYPNYGLLTGAHSGNAAWTINKDSLYGSNAVATLSSPYFNFTQASNLVLSFWQNRNTEANWDGMHLEYTLDELTWIRLGGLNDPAGENWYTDTIFATGGLPGWEGSSGGWVKSSYKLSLLDSVPMVRFRFVFSSDPYVAYEGVSVDDFQIRQRPGKDISLKNVHGPLKGCQLGLETVTAEIRNEGRDTLYAIPLYYHVVGALSPVAEVFADTLLPDSSVIFSFATKIQMATAGHDSLFTLKVYAALPGDSLHDNDTLWHQVLSGSIPANPIPLHQTISYGTSTLLTATSADTLFWFSQPSGGTALYIGDTLQTPLLYDSTTYWVEARAGLGTLRFTELTLESTGAGSTNPYPPYIPPSTQWDGVEISNTGNSQVDLTGFIFHMEGYKTLDYTLPSGVVLAPGEMIVLTLYAYPFISGDSAARFYIAGNQSVYSTAQLGFWLEGPGGGVEDAFAVNGYQFGAGSPVGTSDWSGAIPSALSSAGVIRTGGDSNTAADWVLSGLPSPVQTIGTYNPQLPQVLSLGCPGIRIPINVFMSSYPSVDAGVVTILAPVSSDSLTSAETLKVMVKNFGTQPLHGFSLAYSLDNGAPVSQAFTDTIAPGDTLQATFATLLDLSAFQIFELSIWSVTGGDTVTQNDTLKATIIHQLPDFCLSAALYTSLADIGNVTFGPLNNTSASGLKTYSDFTTLPPESFIQGISYPVSVTMQPQSTYIYIFGIKVYVDLDGNGLFDSTQEVVLQGLTTANQTYVSGNFTIPYGVTTGLARMRVVMSYNSTLNNIHPCGTYSYGETEDYTILLLPPLAYDAGVRLLPGITPPLIEGSSLLLKAWVKNLGSDTLIGLPLGWMISGQNPFTDVINTTLHPGDSLLFTFSNMPVIPPGIFTLKVFTDLTNDGYRENDTLQVNLLGEKDYTSFFFDDFEHDDLNGWAPEMTTLWQHGKPAANVINAAHSPTQVWTTRLSGNYLHNVQKGLVTPEFNFTGMHGLALRFWHWYETEYGIDGGNVKYSVNGGTTFITMGYIGDPLGVNWYNCNASGKLSFSGSSGKWVYSSYDLSAFDNSTNPVKFKFDFFSNSTISFNGWALDDFMITVEKESRDAGVTDILLPVLTVPAGQSFSVMVRIKNFGKDTLTSIPLAFSINGGLEFTDTWTGNLLPGSTIVYSLATTAVSPGYMEIKAYTKLTGDYYLFNDAASRKVGHIGVSELYGGFNLSVSPNPADELMAVSFTVDQPGYMTLTLFDLTGRMVSEQSWISVTGENRKEIEVEGLTPGLYQMVLTSGQGRSVARVMIR